MRDPLYPTDAMDVIDIYCGGYPSDTIWGGVLFWRPAGAGNWMSSEFEWAVTVDPNTFFLAELNNQPYTAGTEIEYYLAMEGNPDVYNTTYVFGNDDTTHTSGIEADARAAAFRFTVGHSGPQFTATPAPHTPTPADTPVSPTPTQSIPTATPTPDTSRLGVTLEMPKSMYQPGDIFYCKLYAANPGDAIPGLKLVALLDVGIGEYWFWPSWSHFSPDMDYEEINLGTGVTERWILPEFNWPQGTGTGSGVMIYAALLNSSMSSIVGEMDVVEFGWTE